RWSSSGKNLYEIPFLNFCLKCKVEHSSDAMSFNGKIECTERMAMNDREVYRDFRSIGAKFPRRNYVLIGKFNGNTLMMKEIFWGFRHAMFLNIFWRSCKFHMDMVEIFSYNTRIL